MALTTATINICGLNERNKQMQVKMLVDQYRIDVLYIQEHNIRDLSRVKYLEDYFEIIMNMPTIFKGGTCFLLNKKSNISVLYTEKDDNGSILFAKVRYNGTDLSLLNIYAPSGSGKKRERENLFSDEILYYLRNNSSNLILAGDYNCVISGRDVSTGNEKNVSQALKSLVRQIGLKDAWFSKNNIPEYTYFQRNYASRIDRVYVTDLYNNIKECKNIPLSITDHNMVLTSFLIDNRCKVGRGYWMLNISLLERDDFMERFQNLWTILKREKINYPNVMHWWESNVKPKIKKFFIKLSRQVSEEKYGLIGLLQSRLETLTSKDTRSSSDFDEMKLIKNRIKSIKDEICEGIKIRLRTEERLNGERISAHLLAKEKSKGKRNTIRELRVENGVKLDNTDAIVSHVKNYYENLFCKVNTDEDMQDFFLNSIQSTITDEDNKQLCSMVTENEILMTLKTMNKGKTPGEDGLPLEFYLKTWKIIRLEFTEMVKFAIDVELELGQSQNKGILKLVPKGGDLSYLKNWRPISLLNIDYKCIAKVLANRLKNVLHKVISKEQFCSVKGRSIVKCNTLMRDIVYYINENDLECALINLDWSKAFDRVHLNFMFLTMVRMGFNEEFIKKVKMLYNGSLSAICINGIISNFFPVERSVRQGCPMSMIAYVLFQEPLYRTMKQNIVPIDLPNAFRCSVLGFADDSSVFVSKDKCIKEVFKIIEQFELATGAELNRDKTSIMGLGSWKYKDIWPVDWLQHKVKCTVLGILITNNYDEMVNENWDILINKIRVKLNMLSTRFLSLYQKAIIINTLILSKVWYISHVLPLGKNKAKVIEQSVFRYLWSGMYQPIKRETLYLPRTEGGIGVLNVYHKSAAILTNTYLNVVTSDSFGQQLALYYTNIRINQLISLENCSDMSYIGTPFYNSIVDNIRKLIRMSNFPNVKSKNIYWVLMPSHDPNVLEKYPLHNWGNIWSNLMCKYVDSNQRSLMYRFLYESLATKERLKMLNIRDSDKCNRCTEVENHMHIVYFCQFVKSTWRWFKNLVEKVCSIKVDLPIRVLMLDFEYKSKKRRNTLIVLIVEYINFMWFSRNELGTTGEKIYLLKSRIKYTKWMLSNVYKLENYFTKQYVQDL